MLQNLLSEQTGVQPEVVQEGITFDEDLAMRKMAAAFTLLEGEASPEILAEQQTIIRLNRQAKTNNLAHRQAILLAKSKNDPLYAKYAKFNGIRLELRSRIYAKYGSKALVRARQLVAQGPQASKK